jgi:hypothetical protein
MPNRHVPQLALQVAKEKEAELIEHLKRQTIYFATCDERTNELRLVGSGVAGDLRGTKVIFTAGHVLRDLERDLAEERVFLSINVPGRLYRLPRHTTFLVTSGGVAGPDAGVVLLAESDASTYFTFSGLDATVRATTVQATMIPSRIECFIAGYPQCLSQVAERKNWDRRIVEVGLDTTIVVSITAVMETDAMHAWLWGGDTPVKVATDESMPLPSLNGMSGGGCWTMELDDVAKEIKCALWAVHTGTMHPKLRETPLFHHLGLLSEHSEALRAKVKELWPNAVS